MQVAIRHAARSLIDRGMERRDAIIVAARLSQCASADECDVKRLECGPYAGLTAVVLPGWVADDGNAPVEYPMAESGEEAAREYVSTGDWGDDGGSVDVWAWRPVLVVAYDESIAEVRVDEESHCIDLVPDHSALIRSAVGRYGHSCGDSPDDHEWTADGEGGCDENPGVWAAGGTSMVFRTHCRQCGLMRTISDPGSQRNPGDGITYEYEMADDDQIERWRASGAMDDAG